MAETSPDEQAEEQFTDDEDMADQEQSQPKVDRRRKTAIDPLDEVMATAQGLDPQDYFLPDELLGDPGSSLKFVCLVNFPHSASQAIQECFGVSRQSAWLWCSPGKGVPINARNRLIELTSTKKKGHTGIWLPRNISAEDLMRVESVEGRPPFQGRNQFLLKLLSEVVSGKHEGLELGTLDSLVESHIPHLGSPHRMWQWAYMQGGIPESYVGVVLKGMTNYGFHRCMNMSPAEFASFLRRYMVTPKRSASKKSRAKAGSGEEI